MKENMINNSLFTIKNENGETVQCEVIFTFESPETKKDYIVYTDNTKTEDGSIRVYANSYDKTGADKTLLPIESDEEWNTIESILAKLETNSKGE